MTSKLVQAIENAIDTTLAQARAIMPGKVSRVARADAGERDVDFDPGIGVRQGGEERADGTVPAAAVLYPAGGGFSMVWPLEADDEGVALVSDRNVGRWRQNRTVGQAHTLERSHNPSDALILPFSITAPEPAPANPDGDWVLTGPQGEAVRVYGDSGTVVISRGSTTIELEDNGDVTIMVGAGASVNLGGTGAAALALGQKVIDAIDTMLAGGVATPNDGGAGLKTTMTAAWGTVKATILAQKAKGL